MFSCSKLFSEERSFNTVTSRFKLVKKCAIATKKCRKTRKDPKGSERTRKDPKGPERHERTRKDPKGSERIRKDPKGPERTRKDLRIALRGNGQMEPPVSPDLPIRWHSIGSPYGSLCIGQNGIAPWAQTLMPLHRVRAHFHSLFS